MPRRLTIAVKDMQPDDRLVGLNYTILRVMELSERPAKRMVSYAKDDGEFSTVIWCSNARMVVERE